MVAQVLEAKPAQAKHPSLAEFSICAAPDCLSPTERASLVYCRTCLVRLYEVAPDAVERLYGARTRREVATARMLLAKADHTCGIRKPSPLSDHERRMGTHLARSLFWAQDFDALLRMVPVPLFKASVRSDATPERRHYLLYVANLYDRAQIARGDPRRSVRS